MKSSDSQLRSPGVPTGFGARVLDQQSNRPVPLGADAADVGATDFGRRDEVSIINPSWRNTLLRAGFTALSRLLP